MGNPRDLSRRSIRPDLITEVHLEKRFPEPPSEMMKLPGVARWISEMQLARERDNQALHRLIHSLHGEATGSTGTGIAGEQGPQGIQGEAGVPGPTGPTGPTGPAGSGSSGGGGMAAAWFMNNCC